MAICVSRIASGHPTLCQGLFGNLCKENHGLIGARESGKNSEGEGRQPVGELWEGVAARACRGEPGPPPQYDTASGRWMGWMELEQNI